MTPSRSESEYAREKIGSALDIVLSGRNDIKSDLLKAAMSELVFLCDSYFEGEALMAWRSIHKRLARRCHPMLGLYGATIAAMTPEDAIEIVNDLRRLEYLLG